MTTRLPYVFMRDLETVRASFFYEVRARRSEPEADMTAHEKVGPMQLSISHYASGECLRTGDSAVLEDRSMRLFDGSPGHRYELAFDRICIDGQADGRSSFNLDWHQLKEVSTPSEEASSERCRIPSHLYLVAKARFCDTCGRVLRELRAGLLSVLNVSCVRPLRLAACS